MLLSLCLLIVGYFLGVLTCNLLFKESFKRYTEELHRQYKEALEKIKKEYVKKETIHEP